MPRSCENIKKALDKQVLKIYLEWEKEAKKRLDSFLHQMKGKEKYDELQQKSSMHADFLSEKERKWQWPACYVAVATPTDNEDAYLDTGYDVHDAWARLRQRHAQECWDFVRKHQAACWQNSKDRMSADALLVELRDRIQQFYVAQGDMVLPGAAEKALSFAKDFVDDWLRAHWAVKKKAYDDKRAQLLKAQHAKEHAQTDYMNMDPCQVLFSVLLQRESKNGLITIDRHRDPLLALYIDNNPDVKDKYNIKFKDKTGDRNGKNKYNHQNPSQSRSSSRSSRSSSRKSGTSRTSSRSSGSGLQKNQGKGKGKGKGKGRGSGKGKKKSTGIRDRPGTPMPSPTQSPRVRFADHPRKNQKKRS